MSTSHVQITASIDISLYIELQNPLFWISPLIYKPTSSFNFSSSWSLVHREILCSDYTSMDAFQSTLLLTPQTFVVNVSVENKPTKAQVQETPILFYWCPLSLSCMSLTIAAPLVKLSESQLSFWANKANPIHFTNLSQVMQFPNYHSFISCIKIRPWYTTLGNVTLATFLEEALDIHVWTAITSHRRWNWQRVTTLALTFPPLMNLLAKHRQ